MSSRYSFLRTANSLVFVLLLLGGMLSGCGSKEEQVAIAPPPEASQDTVPQDAGDSGAVEAPSSDSGDALSEPVEDGTEVMVEEAPADESSVMTNEGGEVMAEDGTVMENEDGTVMENEGGGAVNPNAPPPKPKTLREQADQAFASGHEKAALRLLQAHLLATPAEAAEILSNYRWSPMRKQPQMLARVAVGVDLENPHTGLKTLGPIGSIKKRQSTRANRNPEELAGLIGSDSPAAAFTYNNKERVLQKFAGMMGDSLVQHVRETHQQGMWSPYFKSNSGVSATAGSTQANTMVAAAPSEDGSVEESSGDENGSMNIATNPAMAAPLATKIVGSESKYISLGPTLSFLGVAKAAKLHEYAKEGSFDALIVFDVKIDINLKVRLVYNTCQAKLFTVGDTKPIAVSKPLKNTEAQTEIDKTGMAYVDKAMQALNAALDARVSLTEIPGALTSELIKTKRLPVILADTARSKLETLCEIRLYREKGFLTDEDVATSFATLLGAETSKKLLGGTDAERLEVAQKLLDATAGR
jgi:hypothetical protein